jgi:hypothetical protein
MLQIHVAFSFSDIIRCDSFYRHPISIHRSARDELNLTPGEKRPVGSLTMSFD